MHTAPTLLAALVLLPTALSAGDGAPPGLPALPLAMDEPPLQGGVDNHSCASGAILDDLSVVGGLVDAWTPSRWYFHYDDDEAVAYVLQPMVAGAHVQTTLTDADLYVYRYDPWTCTGGRVCSSIAGAGRPDLCLVNTGYWNVIEVRYYSGGDVGHADYTLVVAAA